MVARSYQVLAADIKSLFVRVLFTCISLFEVFRAYLSEFSIFFHEIYMVARSYQVLEVDIKGLLMSALVSLETRLKVPILAIFGRFLAFFNLPFRHKPRTMIALLELSPSYVLSRVSIVMTVIIKLKINSTQTKSHPMA